MSLPARVGCWFNLHTSGLPYHDDVFHKWHIKCRYCKRVRALTDVKSRED